MTRLSDPLPLRRGPALANRMMLAPLTNQQSHADGRLSDAEFRWLTMRAQGGFALTMTCAAHVQKGGQAFPGQLGIWSDAHLPGLSRLASAIRAAGSVSAVQLHHGGRRTEPDLTGEPRRAPWDDAETGAIALTTADVEQLRDDFIAAALRAERAGFDGVELHGAHGYLICQFLSPEINRREDAYGGSLENRERFLLEIIDGVRATCRSDFSLGVRLSPERFGLRMAEIRSLAAKLMLQGKIDYLDLSLWDVFKEPEEQEFKGRPLVAWFAELERGSVRVGAAGKLTTGAACVKAMEAGLDFVVVGRGAILHHDFPKQVAANPDFKPVPLPVAAAHLEAEGLGPAFLNYMRTWKGFVAEAA